MKHKITLIALITYIFIIVSSGCENNTPSINSAKMANFTIEVVNTHNNMDTIVFKGFETTMFCIDSVKGITWLSAVDKNTTSKITLDVGTKKFRIIDKKVQ